MAGLIVSLFVSVFCAAHIYRALRTGIVRPFSGWPVIEYRRGEHPFGFWGGIAQFVLIPLAIALAVLLDYT